MAKAVGPRFVRDMFPVRKGYQRKTTDEPATVPLSAIGCKTRLGELLKHYFRKAA